MIQSLASPGYGYRVRIWVIFGFENTDSILTAGHL